MKEKIRIKSFSKGLTLLLDDQIPFDDLEKEVASKFAEGKNFFGDETVALSFSGRKLTEQEEIRLVDVIEVNCFLKISCIVEKDEAKDKFFLKTIQLAEIQRLYKTEVDKTVVIRGNVSDGQKLEVPENVVIIGDVDPGCQVSSEKSILVLGTLYGSATAGKDSKEPGYIVAALEMTPEALTIGDFKYCPPKKSKWGKKQKKNALVAKIQGDAIIMEEFTKEHLKAF